MSCLRICGFASQSGEGRRTHPLGTQAHGILPYPILEQHFNVIWILYGQPAQQRPGQEGPLYLTFQRGRKNQVSPTGLQWEYSGLHRKGKRNVTPRMHVDISRLDNEPND